MKRSRTPIAAVAAALALSVAFTLSATPVGSGYAGSAACAECHEDVYAEWVRTAHARTLRPASASTLPAEMVGGATVFHPPGKSRFSRKGDRFFVTTTGDDGSERTFPLTHSVGVRRIRMFLTRLDDGRLQVLPSMLEEPTGEWFDYSHLIFGVPGTDPRTAPRIAPGEPTFWTGVTRSFDARCARCHTTDWRPVAQSEGAAATLSEWHESGVGCESCHGPAADHAAYHGEDPPAGLESDPILLMDRLPRDRAVGVCLRCHMEAEPVAPGFLPGEDHLAHFDPTLLDDTERVDPAGRPLELIYDGLPFSSSVCVLKGELTCVTCHAPHGSPQRSQLRTHRLSPELCADCHEEEVAAGAAHSHHEAGGAGASCVGCHMPLLEIERGHGRVTDHTMGVPHPGVGPDAAEDACTWCHSGARGAPGGVPLLEPERLRKAHAEWWPDASPRPSWAAVLAAGRAGADGAAEGLLSLVGNEEAPRVARASAALLLGRLPEAPEKELIRLARHEDDLVRRSAVAGLARVRSDLADAVLHKALLDDSAGVRYRAVRAALAGWARVRENRTLNFAVISALEEETAAFPEDDRRWFLLGAAHQIAGNRDAARRAYEQKLALDPYAVHVREAVQRLR